MDITETVAATPPPRRAEPTAPSFVFAIGRIEPRYPSLAVEKELAQAFGSVPTAGLTDREALYALLSERGNRYLARQLCWVFTVEGLDTYLLVPADSADIDLLIDAARAGPQPTDIDVVIGVRGPLASPQMCNGLVVPVMTFDQIYSFDRNELLAGIPVPDDMNADLEPRFRASATELFDRLVQVTDNAGATDDHRALNYLAVRYPAIYARTAQAHAANSSLSRIDVRPSRLTGARKILDVVFSYTHRLTDVTEQFFVRVDVTEEFPFLVTRLSSFYER
jgi:cyclic patellamide precursor peptide PatG